MRRSPRQGRTHREVGAQSYGTLEVSRAAEREKRMMGTRVLVVDDDRATVEMLTLALEMDGFDVVSASTGPEALDAAKTHRPDVLVLDVMMPGMTGLDVVRQIREDATLADTPVLLLSAWARDVDVWSGWMAGADAYVTKPMDVDDLLTQVSRLSVSGPGRLVS